MTNARRSRPGGTETASTLTDHHTAILVSDWRCRARLTEQGLQPIDVALTFTGLAAEMLEVAR